jgi:hypothetical protein
MKKLLLVLLAMVMLGGWAMAQVQQPEDSNIQTPKTEESTYVTVLMTGRFYHILPCPKFPTRSPPNSKLIKIEDAKEQGYKPCPQCVGKGR